MCGLLINNLEFWRIEMASANINNWYDEFKNCVEHTPILPIVGLVRYRYCNECKLFIPLNIDLFDNSDLDIS